MKILITSGGTTEKIDAVRGITNHSTGYLGKEIAELFLAKGHHVTLVTTKTAVKPEPKENLKITEITNVESLLKKMEPLVKEHDVLIHSMAVSDYTPIYIELLQNGVINPEGEILKEDNLLEILPELNNGLHKNKVIERKEKDINTIKVRKNKYDQIKKLWELLNKKYIIKYSEFSNDEIERALLNILNEGINSSDVITTERQLLNITDNSTNIIEMAGISLSTNKKMKYNEFIIKLSELTNIPIMNIHNTLVKYSQKHKIDNDFFNSTVLSKFYMKINDWKADKLFKRFTYQKTNLPIHPTSLTTEDGTIKDTIVLGNVGTSRIDDVPQERYLYDTIAFDSDIEKSNILEQINEVTVFGKIPKNSIKIPVANGGTYSPDFMYLVDKKDGSSELNLIIESKDVESERDLRGQEKYKIECAKKLFEQLNKEGINIKFRKQLSNDKVGTIVRNLIN